ncbi:MAG: MFS transporter [Anaerolineae bacterium]|nr:MFS transporter [Anaerolineae bacterium]
MDRQATEVAVPSKWATAFFTIWIGQAFSLVGSRVGDFALVWWLTKTTSSATVLATATLVALLPGVILGPIAGALVDRWSRKWVMAIADSIVALFAAGLAMLVLSGTLQVWHIYVFMFMRSLGGTFHWPAMQASTSMMVPKTQLSRVAGMNQTLQGVMSVLTPPLGAFLMELLPLHTIMTLDVATAAFAVVPLFFVFIPQLPRREFAAEQSVVVSLAQDIKAGILYIWHWPGMFILMLVATLLNLTINPAMSLMPILVTKYFGGDVLQLGWLESAWGIGVIGGGVLLSVWGGFHRKIVTSMIGLIGAAVGFIVVGLTPPSLFWMAWVGMLLAGFMNPIINGPFFAILQDAVPSELQGRVFTVTMSIAAAASPLGMAIAGPISDWLGVQVWFLIGGITWLMATLVMGLIPAVMHLEE